ncbi:MAG: DMT family transporter [Kiloniellales bacterium]|nr:DMT family transporter [Kiloniellales bacterium]
MAAPAGPGADYRLGIASLLLSGFFASLAGLLVRSVETAGGWQILFYRTLFCALTLALFLAWRHGGGVIGAFRRIGRSGLIVVAGLGFAFIFYIFALLSTTVANVVFIVSASPFVAAALGWIALREPVTPGLWLAMIASFLGLAIMLGDGLAQGSLVGFLLALGCCLGYAVTLVALRSGRAVDMLPACCLAAFAAAAVSAAFVPSFALSAHDLVITLLLGVLQLALQYILVTYASRRVQAAEIAFFSRVQVVLAPLWVWIGVGEVPSLLTLLGGLVVFSAVLGNAAFSWRAGGRRSAVG